MPFTDYTVVTTRLRVLNTNERDTLERALAVMLTLPPSLLTSDERYSAQTMLVQEMPKRMFWAEPVGQPSCQTCTANLDCSIRTKAQELGLDTENRPFSCEGHTPRVA
jgi:hypothetical protein